ncbi:aldo/keto reductase [Streptomyces sp. NPDC014892]|uniref:aldo/keto reductase n=1 Tax=Streptomyces sp. NPDC014892 TaxID=3364930 RepID=UPI003701EF0F
MKYRTLGWTGTVVSNVGLGTMGFGTETAQDDAFAVLDAFIDAGGNLLDTADAYGDGASEEVLGRWFASRPASTTDRALLATKARFAVGPDANANGLSRRHLRRALDASLHRLGRDNVDLYQLHSWDPLTPVEETAGFLGDAIAAGKITYYGLSNFTGWQTQLFVSTARAMGVPLPATMQAQYSLAAREIEFEVVPASLHNGIGILPWSPLASGFLSGKYRKEETAAQDTRGGGSHGALFEHVIADLTSRDQNWSIVEVLREVASELGAEPSQVALSWIADRPGVVAPLIGAKHLRQLQQNLAAADLALDESVTERLEQVSAPRPNDYPYGPFGQKQRDRYVHSSDTVMGELFDH